MSIQVSVIIPVYNAEKYLAECIESLLGQTLKKCEFIFINDGSKDSSLEILESYQKIDCRMMVVDQENQGVSMARNRGLSLASGEYVGFVDADDYIEKDMFDLLYHEALESDCDIVVSDLENEIDGQKLIIKYPFPRQKILQHDFMIQEILPYFIKKDDLNSACTKLYKTKMVHDNRIQFPIHTSLGEDGIFNIHAFCYARKVRFIDYTGYHYRETYGSATRNILQKDYFKRVIEVYHSDLPSVMKGKIGEGQIQLWKAIKLVNSVLSLCHLYFKTTKDLSFLERYQYVKNMISHPSVREALQTNFSEIDRSLGRYERALLRMIKAQWTFGLYSLTEYSRFRNRKWGA